MRNLTFFNENSVILMFQKQNLTFFKENSVGNFYVLNEIELFLLKKILYL